LKRRASIVAIGALPFLAALQGCSEAQNPAAPVAAGPETGPDGMPTRSFDPPSVAGVETELSFPTQAGVRGPTPAQPLEPERDPLSVEKFLYNLGYQSNLGARVRQDLNLFALLVPDLKLFAPGEKLDRQYLAPGITNQALYSSLFSIVLPHANLVDVHDANEFIKSPAARSFIVDFWSSVYDGGRFVEFMSKPFKGSDWRRDAILTLNRLWFLDSMQAASLRPLAPLLLARLRLTPQSPGVASIESLAYSLSFFRTAWAAQGLSDDDLFRLTVESRKPAVVRSLSLVAGAFGSVCQQLAKAMDAGLPPDLSGFRRSALSSLKTQAPL
jgi:hypothetical protein